MEKNTGISNNTRINSVLCIHSCKPTLALPCIAIRDAFHKEIEFDLSQIKASLSVSSLKRARGSHHAVQIAGSIG